MNIISNNKEKEIIVITYFKLDRKNEYLLYTDTIDGKEKTIYLANVIDKDDKLELILPTKEELAKIKKIIENFLDKDIDKGLLLHNSYEYIDINELNDKNIEEINPKLMTFSKEKYIKLLSNKYITYPEEIILNIEEIEKEGYDKNNKVAINISLKALGIYYFILLLIQIITRKPLDNILELNAITFMMWSLIICLFSMVAFNFEEKTWLESWLVVIITITCFTYALMFIQHQVNVGKDMTMSLIYSIIFIIPYCITKRIAFYIVNKFKCRNYITYYSVYLLPFILTISIVILIYNTFFISYINDFLKVF